MEDQHSGPTLVYLDMNIWVAMTRACQQGDARWMTVRSSLDDAVSSGRIVVPLAVAHYLELWHRREQRSREQVGGVMRDVSGYATLPSPYAVRRREVRTLVSRLVSGVTLPAPKQDLIGQGAAYAFDSPHGRFRFVDSLAAPDGSTQEGQPTSPPGAMIRTCGWLSAR